jgi:hypothetical protein
MGRKASTGHKNAKKKKKEREREESGVREGGKKGRDLKRNQ